MLNVKFQKRIYKKQTKNLFKNYKVKNEKKYITLTHTK